MKYQALLYLSALLLFFGCQKDDKFSYDQTQRLEFSSDSVLFDTVFTSVGSVTQRIKVFNRAKKAVRISEIKLEGAGHSPFSININGVPANQLSDVEIPGNDSIYVFVKVTIDPNSSENPFLIADSLRFSSNNNQQYLHLRAYGQNARFIKGGVIDTDTSWDDKLPWVIYDSVKINPGKTLRFPTFHEERFMTYEAIINGARGVVYFGGNLPMTLNERDKPLGWNWTFWQRVREVGNDVYVLACSRDPQKTSEITFSGLPRELGEGVVLYESPRRVKADAGQMRDWFAPYEVHVYKFTRG